MTNGSYILTTGGQNMTWPRGNFFLERNLFVTGNLIRLLQFFAKARRGREFFSSSQIRRTVGLAGQFGFAVLFKNRALRFFDERWKVCADAVSNAQRQFQCRIAKPPLDEAQHGFGNARTLRDRIIGESPADALLPQEPDNFMANRFVVTDTRHAEAWQRKWFDLYFAIVKNRFWLESGLLSQN